MGFLDKLAEVTKQVTDKTSDVINIGKINIKISNVKKEIDGKAAAIGDYYINRFDLGAQPEAEIASIYEELLALRVQLAELETELEGLNEKTEAAAEAEVKSETIEPSEIEVKVAPKNKFCSNCGAPVQGKFCGDCGARLED